MDAHEKIRELLDNAAEEFAKECVSRRAGSSFPGPINDAAYLEQIAIHAYKSGAMLILKSYDCFPKT